MMIRKRKILTFDLCLWDFESDIEADWPIVTLISCRDGRQVCDVLEGLYENLLCPLDSLLVSSKD